jgi:signal transduction histidine kinase
MQCKSLDRDTVMKSVGKSISLYYTASVVLIIILLAAVTISSVTDPAIKSSDEVLNTLMVRWVICGIPILIIVLSVAALLSRRALSPIEKISRQLSQSTLSSPPTPVQLVETDEPFPVLVSQLNSLAQTSKMTPHQMHQFSAKVAHELVAPITLLQLQIDYAAPTLDPELATSLKGQINRLGDYVETALLVARAERGAIPINKESLPVNEYFSDLIKPYELRAKFHRRRITTRFISTKSAEIDPKIVAVIFNNLISNAFYHGIGEIQVVIRESGSAILLSIANHIRTGPRSNYWEGGTGMGFRTIDILSAAHGDLKIKTRKFGNTFGAAFWIGATEDRFKRSSA